MGLHLPRLRENHQSAYPRLNLHNIRNTSAERKPFFLHSQFVIMVMVYFWQLIKHFYTQEVSMIKKNTYSFYHKRIRTALCAVLCSVLTAMPAFATGEDNSPTAAASTTVWTKASEIMQDVYSQIISIRKLIIFFMASSLLLLCLLRSFLSALESPNPFMWGD